MTKARIYRPDKNAMQSGKAGMKHWVLEFTPDTPLFVEPLMGWTGARETTRQVQLTFPTQEAAVEYAKKNGIPFEVSQPRKRSLVKKTYADNFKFRKTS